MLCTSMAFGEAWAYLENLFVEFSTITKVTHPYAPSLVATAFKCFSHQGFNLFVGDPIFSLYVGKADVI